MNSDLTQAEKEELYEALTYVEFPDHDYIQTHNNNINFNQAPNEVNTQSSTYIKNAWMKINSITPTVQIEDNLYHNGEGNIQLASNYNIQLPSRTERGDCKTKYSVSSASTSYTITDDGNNIGYTFNKNNDLNLEAQFTITATIKVKHYRQTERGCKYSHTETRTDQITIQDYQQVLYYNEPFNYDFEILDEAHNSYHGEFNTTSAFDLNFEDSTYQKRTYYYSYETNFEPYSVLTVKAVPYEREFSQNININQNQFTVPNINNCEITLYNHFEQQIEECNTEYNETDIQLTTDQQYYNQGETINLTIEPDNIPVIINYNEIIEIATANTQLTANETGLITATYNSKTDSEMVFVQAEQWSSFWNFGYFSTIIYILSNLSVFVFRRFGL